MRISSRDPYITHPMNLANMTGLVMIITWDASSGEQNLANSMVGKKEITPDPNTISRKFG